MRSYAEIDLNALENNIREIRRVTNPDSKIMAVIKADAYGHGFLETAKVLTQNGADCFGVATIEEALQIRCAGFKQDILILGGVDVSEIEKAVNNCITLSVYTRNFAKAVSDVAVRLNKTAKIHIKLDTGMSRIGFLTGSTFDDKAVDEIIEIAKFKNVYAEGIFSHFSTSDEADTAYTELQFERFTKMCKLIEEKGYSFKIKHIANSAAIMQYPEMHLDMVRPGIILYGLYPSDEVDKERIKLKQVMTLKSKITHVKELPPDRGISYGKEYITDEVKKVATVPIGYADGYLRIFAKEGYMLVKNQKVKILGRICMDQCMIDVTNVNNINTGDEVTIFTHEEITADTLAGWAGTINYEIVCMISKRIPRIYQKDGRTVNVVNYLDC